VPDLATDPAQLAPPPDPGGAVPSGGAGGGPDAMAKGQQPGVLPPSTGPTPQNVPPAGLEALAQDFARKAMAQLHLARMAANPYTKHGEAIDKAWHTLAKHFAPDPETMKGGGMAQPGPQQGPPGQAAGGPPMAPGAQPNPAPPQGPIPMKPPGGP